MEQTRAEAPGGAGATALHHPGVRGAPAVPAARGEHVHSEPTAPVAARDAASLSSSSSSGEPSGPRVGMPRRHSVRGQVLAALRNALIHGDLVPGEVYSAPALAERYGVSPTPVREAMQQLVSEGAVETVPNRGFRVTERTPRDAAELAEVRSLLEIPSVLRLARTLPSERWRELRVLADATVAAAGRGERPAYAEADRVFHRTLLEMTGNRQLALIAEDVQRRAQWPAAPLPASALLGAALEHTALLDALQSRDLVRAEGILRAHVTGS